MSEPIKYEKILAEPPEGEITYKEYLAVIGLLELAKQYNAKLQDLERSLASILNEFIEDNSFDGYYGHVSDAIYEGYSAKELLDRLQIMVIPSGNEN